MFLSPQRFSRMLIADDEAAPPVAAP
eukprot:COSAG01_NODE_63103_length_281_cov_0.873626_1_plen_25_part_01